MPILAEEPVVWPENLFSPDAISEPTEVAWSVLHTRPRAEKALARMLFRQSLSFFLPVRQQRHQFRGRSKTSFLPVFPSYMFVRGTDDDRLAALKTNLVVRTIAVDDQEQLSDDLWRVHRLLESGMPISTVDRLEPGTEAEITAGRLCGMRGTVVRRGSSSKIIVEVHMLQQGVSVEVEESMIQPVWQG